MNLARPGPAVDIESLGKLGRSLLRLDMKNVAECGALAAEQ